MADFETLRSLAVIGICGVLAPILVEPFRRLRVPSVVFELLLGILIGPQVLHLARVDSITAFLAEMGLTFLVFLAGFEINLKRLKGRPLQRATVGWLISLGLGLGVAGVMVATNFALSDLVIGLALTTTALTTLLPILRDAEILPTSLGVESLAVGTLGEFGPLLAIGLLLTGKRPGISVLVLGIFAVVSIAAAYAATLPQPPAMVGFLRRHLHSSVQLPIRISLLLILLLVMLARGLGIDILLGAFAAGIVIRLFTLRDEEPLFEQKLHAIGFGFLIPIFFIVSGMNFDLRALFASPSTVARVPLFLVLLLIVRGLPTWFLADRSLSKAQRRALSLFSASGFSLIVVITSLGVSSGRMHPANAAALIGAGMISIVVFPSLGLFGIDREQRKNLRLTDEREST